MLQRLLLQLAAVAHQLAPRLVLDRRDAHHAHAALLAAHPGAQRRHQRDRVEPIGLGPPRMARDLQTGRIAHQGLVAEGDQVPRDPERVLAGLVQKHRAHGRRQAPLRLDLVDLGQHRVQARRRLLVVDVADRGVRPLAIVKCQLPLARGKLH